MAKDHDRLSRGGRVGHENRTTTEIYLHSIGEAEREAMAVFERACQDAPLEESLTQIHTQEN
jgi:hypothetical protein